MKTQCKFFLAAMMLIAGAAGAEVLNEWTFETDPIGQTLSLAENSGTDGAPFSVDAGGVTSTDGEGGLVLNHTAASGGFWTDGAILYADSLNPVPANSLFLRYDVEYDMTSASIDSGTLLALAFADRTTDSLAGISLGYNVEGTAPPVGVTETTVERKLALTGRIAVIAEVNVASGTMNVWYNLTGDNSFAAAPNATVTGLNLMTIRELEFRATGDFIDSPSNQCAVVEYIRTATTFAEIIEPEPLPGPSVVWNEWTFETDPSGETLSQAENSGLDGAVFPADSGVTRTDGNGGLVVNNVAAGEGGLWTDGATLSADVTNSIPEERRYLRYDIEYDMTSEDIDSGTLLALSFADRTSDNLAGVAIRASLGEIPASPDGTTATVIRSGLAPLGRIAVIAEVDLAAGEMNVWYNLSGQNSFSVEPNETVTNLNLMSIEELEFRATGDFIDSPSNQCAVVENIRTASDWEKITDPLADHGRSPEPVITRFSDELRQVMKVGETNTLTVVIKNTFRPATSVISQLEVNAPPGDFTIISANTPAPAGVNALVTNTFQVVAHVENVFRVTARATSDGNAGAPATLDLSVGRRVSLDTYVVVNDVGGIYPGIVEPGESFDLIISSVNDGADDVTDITNSLAAPNSTWFPTVTASNTTVYPSLTVGATASTLYHLTASPDTPNGLHTFTVVNKIADRTWVDTFELDVFSRADFSVDPAAITLRVAPGETNSLSVDVLNSGNFDGVFTVTDDGRRPTLYSGDAQSTARIWFGPADFQLDTVFDSWDGTETEPMAIGFDPAFLLFGTEYHTFFVSQEGFITLESTNEATATLTVFNSGTPVEQSTVRYEKSGERLVVAWGNTYPDDQDTLEFQIILNADGTVQYLYEYGTWPEGEIGMVGDQIGQVINHDPGQTGQDALLLTPASWVTYSPTAGTIEAFGGTQALTFTADASRMDETVTSTNVFVATVNGAADSEEIEVTVIVEPANAQLNVPGTFAFSGPAGFISSPATLTVSNSGNVALSYVITDTGLANASYNVMRAGYGWQHIPEDESYILDESQLNSDLVPIGFPFVYFGNTYTQMIVLENGGLLPFGSNRAIFPFGTIPNLMLDDNASVRVLADIDETRCTVTWENMAHPGEGNDQTFQTVLHRDGTIRFNYKVLTGTWTNGFNGVMQLNDDDTEEVVVEGTLINEDTADIDTIITFETESVTNWMTIGNVSMIDSIEDTIVGTNTNVVVTADYTLTREALELIPGQPPIISFSPVSGTIPVGGTADITLIGDARGLTGDGTNDVDASTTLTFTHAGGSGAAAVTFTASNSVETAYSEPIVQAAMWGSDEPVISSQMNPDGSRRLSWPAPGDSLSRTYTVWYTTSLGKPWVWLATVANGTSYLDDQHNKEPVIFYKVTVE